MWRKVSPGARGGILVSGSLKERKGVDVVDFEGGNVAYTVDGWSGITEPTYRIKYTVNS